MRIFRLLVLRRLRASPLRTAATVLSIAAGVSLAVSITVLLASIDRSLEDFGRGLAGPAPLRITGATLHGGLPDAAVDAATDVAGVAEVIPMIQAVGRTQASPGGPLQRAVILGVDCRAEALLGPFGCDDDALVASRGPVAVGPRQVHGPDALLRTDLGRMAMGDAPVLDDLTAVADGRAVVLPLALAQERFTRPGQVDVAYVLLDPGADLTTVRADLQAAVGDQLPVQGAIEPPAGADAVLGAALPIYSLLGIFALAIGAVLVANTAAMSLEARRRQLAVFALGGRRRTVVGTAVAEMALLGAAGGILGAGGGALVAAPIVGSFSSFTEQFTGATLSTHVPVGALVTGVVLGGLLGGGAALWPAIRATRLDVAAELSGRSVGDTARPARLGRRALVWALLAGVGALGCFSAQRDGGLDPWQATIVIPAFLAATIGSLFATVAAAPLLLSRLEPVARRFASAPLRLALTAASRDHRRTGLLAVTVGAAVVTAFVTEGSSAAARESIEASIRRGGDGVDVSTVPFDETYGPDVPPAVVTALASVPGVAEVHRGSGVLTGMASDPVFVQAITGNRLIQTVIDGEASERRLADGEVLIGAGLARSQAIRAGDEVRVPTPSGTVRLPVQGVWEDGNNVGANITMSPDLSEELFGPQPALFVALSPEDGVSEAELADNIEAAALDPELRTRSSATLADDIADEVDAQFSSFRVMQRALLAVLFAAVLSSLLLAAVQRRQEMALLAAVGAEPTSLATLLLVEAGLVALAGVAASIGVGPLMAFALNQVVPFVVGFRNPVVFDWPAFAIASVVALLVVLVGAAWPARRMARVEVLEALRYE